MTARRICAYPPCARSFESSHSKARYCDPKCKAADWKLRTGYGKRRAVRTEAGGPGGAQISYRKAVAAVTKLVCRIDPEIGQAPNFMEHVVEAALLEALPARQRERLEGKR